MVRFLKHADGQDVMVLTVPHGCAQVEPGRTSLVGNSPPMVKNSPRRVLVVDDEPLIRWSLSETLVEQGFEVLEAGDGHDALEALSSPGPGFDVVVLDFRLPDSNDLKLLARIRDLVPDTRVILMTAHGTPEIVQGALDLGALDVVSKPFEVTEIVGLVSRARGPL